MRRKVGKKGKGGGEGRRRGEEGLGGKGVMKRDRGGRTSKRRGSRRSKREKGR